MKCPKCGRVMIYISIEFMVSGYSCSDKKCRAFIAVREQKVRSS